MRRAVGFFAFALLAACGAEEPVPANPTWVDDVQPILRANCFSCHGAGPRPVGASRWDIYAKTEDRYMIFSGTDAVGAKDNRLIPTFASLTAASSRMPPPPATPLSARDQQVLKLWFADPAKPRGMHQPNQKPTVTWLNPDRSWFVVSDGDHEQVLGKVRCNSIEATVPSTGAHKAPGPPPCLFELSDGQEIVMPMLN